MTNAWGRVLARFGRETEGSVTLQVLVMSLLLLGTTGLVLDAGRAFSTHSQMQAFADQVALAAAAELDRRDDSILRARAAAMGVEEGTPFLTDADGFGLAYEIESLSFFTDLPPQTGTQNSNADAAPFLVTDETAQATEARFVAAKVRGREVRSLVSSMASIAYSMTGTADGAIEQTIRVEAVAIAGLEIQTCADLSTLVFCNPWEGQDDSPFRDADGNEPAESGTEPLTGRSLQTFAPNFARLSLTPGPVSDARDHGSLYPWDVRHQLFRVSDPVSDPSGVCSPAFLLAMAGEDAADEAGADYLEVRDRCLMARARSERMCFADNTIEIRPATGPMVTRALNTIFDIWLPPFDQVVNGTDPVIPNTGLTRAQFFEPDALASTVYEPLPRNSDGELFEPTVNDDGSIVLNLLDADGNPVEWPIDFMVGYDARPTPDAMSMPFMPPVGFDSCHFGTHSVYGGEFVTSTPCSQDFVSDRDFATLSDVSTYLSNYYNVFEVWPTIGTWYDVYKTERADVLAGIRLGSQCQSIQDTLNAGAECDAPRVKTEPVEYLDPDGANRLLLNPGYERRRIRSAVVNCQAATQGGGTGGVFSAPLAGVVDAYVPRPAGYTCPDAPDGTRRINCEVDEQIETRLWVELIGNASQEITERYTAQLVR